MEFRLLGPLEVADDGRLLALGGSKRRSLLAILLVHAGQVVSAGRLIDELWPDTSRATAVRTLHVSVSRAARRFVRRGPRPGGLAPAETRTSFSWSMTAGLR